MFFEAGCTIIVDSRMKKRVTDISMPVISVTGAHSGVGKTSLCVLLLRLLPGFGAIKFTKTDLYTSVVDDPERIMEGQKDTAMMKAAGAEKVIWVRSRPEDLGAALDIALHKTGGLAGIVIEGNSPSALVSPNVTIFVLGADREIKDSALPVMKGADVIVFNAPDNEPLPDEIPEEAPLFRIDLLSGTGEIDKLMGFIKKYISHA
jgi:hypothetical protein